MTEQLPSPPSQDTRNIISWNLLLDKTRTRLDIVEPQSERTESQAKTLIELDKKLDIVMLQEVEGENGRKIAEMTGNKPGISKQHNRQQEYMEVFGEEVEWADFHDLGYGRLAIETQVGGLAVFAVHLTARPKRFLRRANEMRKLSERLRKVDEAMVVGDLNGLWWEPARLMLAMQGFTSASHEVRLKRPITYPTEQYRDIMWTPWQQKILGDGVSVDDISVRGVKVVDAGRFVGDSDHYGLYATVET